MYDGSTYYLSCLNSASAEIVRVDAYHFLTWAAEGKLFSFLLISGVAEPGLGSIVGLLRSD